MKVTATGAFLKLLFLKFGPLNLRCGPLVGRRLPVSCCHLAVIRRTTRRSFKRKLWFPSSSFIRFL